MAVPSAVLMSSKLRRFPITVASFITPSHFLPAWPTP